jgi:hypothetical protein
MAETANITSVDAITAFRAQLIVYLGKARPLLEELSGEIIRMRQWLENDKRLQWEHQFRLRTRKLEEARAELFNARLSKLQEATALQAMAVQRAERDIRECESKLNVIRKWTRNLEPATAPLVKQAEQLQTYLSTEMTRAVAHMDEIVRALENYADIGPEKKESAA